MRAEPNIHSIKCSPGGGGERDERCGGGMGGMGSGRQSNKTKPMVHKLGVSLEELYNGKVSCKSSWINNLENYPGIKI